MLAGLTSLLSACPGSSGGKGVPQRPPPLVVVSKVQLQDVQVTVNAPIDLRPIAQVDVGSKTLGYLDLLLVDRGDIVRKGQLLALVRPSDLPQQLAEARGVLAQTQAAKLLARTNYERSKRLAPSGVVSQQELASTSAALAASEATEAAAKARIETLAIRLGEMRILSPIEGVVSQRRLDPGALVGPQGGGAILTVVRVDTLRAFIAVNERYAVRVALGQEARIELDALAGQVHKGKVVRLAPAFDPMTRTLDAEIHLRNTSGQLRPGMYGRGSIILDTHTGALTVPVGAVVMSGEKKYVFTLIGDSVSRQEVEIGVDGEEWLEITRGLKAGDEVVTAGMDLLANNMRVRVKRSVDPFSGERITRAVQSEPVR